MTPLLAAAMLVSTSAAAHAQSETTTPIAPEVLGVKGCPGADREFDSARAATTRIAVRCLLNDLRTRRGLARVTGHPVLQQAGDSYAAEMAYWDFFDHVDRNGGRIGDRLALLSRGRDWRWVGEVLGWACTGDATPRSVVSAWWASPPHRRAILDRRARRIGVGLASGTPFDCDGVTWAVELGVRY